MSRLPLRIRLTLAFAAVMAVVIAATGLFLFLHLRADLDHAVNSQLAARTGDVRALVAQADTGLRDAAAAGRAPEVAQVLTAGGRVFDATPGLLATPLVRGQPLQIARRRPLLLTRPSAPGLRGPVRLRAAPVRAQGRRLVVVVAASLAARDQAISDLLGLFAIGGPAALLLASLAGYGVAAAALRPVESMRRRAASISTRELGQRLPISGAGDELERLGRTLNEMLDRLAAGIERERAFAAEAGHELRTPLTMLRTELELIARDRPTGQALVTATDAAIEEAVRMSRLVDDLLSLARAESDTLSVRPSPENAGELAADAVARVRRVRPDRSIALTAPSVSVWADRERVGQALANVLDNALRHGSDPIVVTVSAREGGAVLRVRDHGPGFTEELLPRAFDRFARGPRAGAHGSGLGLSIVAAIIRAHGGDVGAANQAGGGAAVWLWLPGVRDFRA